MVSCNEVPTYYGLSTDTKPVNSDGSGGTPVNVVQNGSAFIEMDTGKIYFYDASSGWIEWGAA